MNNSADWKQVKSHYESLRQEWGRSPQGVGWGPKDRQLVRISACLAPWSNRSLHVVDVGCGYGAAVAICGKLGFTGYHGVDLLDAGPIESRPSCRGLEVSWTEANFLEWIPDSHFDVGIASGTLNTRGSVAAVELLKATLGWAKKFCRDGFSFNCLRTPTGTSDAGLNYFSIDDIALVVESFTRRYVIDNSVLPFESTVHCFWKSDLDFNRSSFVSSPP